MRFRAPITVSALMMAGLVTAGSAAHGSAGNTRAHEAAAPPTHPVTTAAPALSRTVGLVTTSKPAAVHHYGSAQPAPDPSAFLLAGGLHDISGSLFGALDIPEIALAAYRNAELRLAQSDPNCGLSWSLLAGIGKIESGHADGGRTDATGTTVTPILGPALDGHLPGNEVLRAADGSFVRAIGPMQFLPGTWNHYASDAIGDGMPDPNNIFDAALAAGRYLCSGGLNLRDPAQELQAVLRYNNSMPYAASVLSWATAYRTGVVPTQVPVLPTVPKADQKPGTAPNQLTPTPANQPPGTPVQPQPPAQQMIYIPGLPPIPCGILCPQPLPAAPAPGQAQATAPGAPAASPGQPAAAAGQSPAAATPSTPLPQAQPAPAHTAQNIPLTTH